MGGIEAIRDEAFDWYVALSVYPLGVIAKWVLGLVFLISGFVKLRDPARAALAMVDFGIARVVRPANGLILGGAEVLLGLLTISLASRVVLSMSALLLWVFVWLILRSVQRGEDFACYCFGDADSHLSMWTAVRTFLIAVLATILSLGYRDAGVGAVDTILAGVAALAIVAGLFLVARVPRLLTWNSSVRRMT